MNINMLIFLFWTAGLFCMGYNVDTRDKREFIKFAISMTLLNIAMAIALQT